MSASSHDASDHGSPASGEDPEGWREIPLGPGRRVPLLDERTLDRIDATLDRARTRGVRAIVFTGGDDVFAAGADLARLRSLTPYTARAFARHGQRVLDRIERFPGVVIVAVTGACIGGAFDLALACDIRIAGPRSRFEHPGPRLGFITGYGGTHRLGRALPGIATEVLAGRRSIDAAEALHTGLCAAVVPEGRVVPEAFAIAGRIAKVPASRIVLVKDSIATFGPGGVSARLAFALDAASGGI